MSFLTHTIREGNRFSPARHVEFTKDCDCEIDAHGDRVTATTGKLLVATEQKGDKVVIRATLHAGPVCDKCERPWVLTKLTTR